jgi:hypothetical protein
MSRHYLADLTNPLTGETRDRTRLSAYYPFEADRTSALLLAPDGLDVATSRRPERGVLRTSTALTSMPPSLSPDR